MVGDRDYRRFDVNLPSPDNVNVGNSVTLLCQDRVLRKFSVTARSDDEADV